MNGTRNTMGNGGATRNADRLPPIQQQQRGINNYQYDSRDYDESDEDISMNKRGTIQGTNKGKNMHQNDDDDINNNYQNDNKAFTINQFNAANYEFDCSDGRPLQLVIANPGSFELNQDAVEEITQFNGNVAFVCVAGKYRTGKSFLLNKILGLKGTGFRVDPTTDSCTQGIWVWSKPLYIEKDNLYVFFLDTEGSNSIEKSAQHDAKIFSLAILMSSFFIYNSVGVIDENAINELSLTTKLSKNIAISTSENSEHALSYYTPKFIWLLRDFTLELIDNRGKPITSGQYLENALTDQSTSSKMSETNKKIRQALLEFFKDRDCITIVRPVDEEIALRRLDKLQDKQLRPEFLRQLRKIKEKIIDKITPKQLRGVNLTPKMYFSAVYKYVEAINNGAVPNISTAWEFMIENECKEALEASINLYEYALKQFFLNAATEAKTMDEIYHILKNIRDKTLEKYNTLTAYIERSAETQKNKDTLKEYLDQREDAAIMINEELAQTNNEELLRILSENMKNNLANGIYGENNIGLYCNDFNEMAQKYDEGAKGLKACSTLITFLNTFYRHSLQSIIAVIKRNYKMAESNFSNEKANLSATQQELERKVKDYEAKEEMYEEQIANATRERERALNKIKDYEKEINKYVEGDYKKKYEVTKGEIEKTEKERAAEKENFDAEMRKLEDMIKTKKKACCSIF